MKFKQKLRIERIKKDLKQSEVAEVLGIKTNTYSEYETGHKYPRPDGLIKISKFFNVSIDYLLKDEVDA